MMIIWILTNRAYSQIIALEEKYHKLNYISLICNEIPCDISVY